jgi:hypothetical protein
MWQYKLCMVDQREQFRPVVLVIVHKGPETLVHILVHDFGLAISLWVESSRELDFGS